MDTSPGSPQEYPSTPGTYNLTTQADGQTVYYTLRIPAGYDGHTAFPVILCLHFGGQPSEFYGGRFLGLIPVSGFGSLSAILVAPTAHQRGWATPTGEAAIFAALAAVEQHLTVDTSRRVGDGLQHGRQRYLAYCRQVPPALCGGDSHCWHTTADRAGKTA